MTKDGRRFLIRPTSTGDADALVAMRNEVAAEGDFIAAAPGDRSSLEEHLTLSSLLTEGGLSLTLELDDRVAGHLTARRLGDTPGVSPASVAEIAIAVHKSARGMGLGRALMETAIDWARAVRLSKLALGVFPSNQRAISLYRSLGFVDEGMLPRRIVMPDGERDLMVMGLPL